MVSGEGVPSGVVERVSMRAEILELPRANLWFMYANGQRVEREGLLTVWLRSIQLLFDRR